MLDIDNYLHNFTNLAIYENEWLYHTTQNATTRLYNVTRRPQYLTTHRSNSQVDICNKPRSNLNQVIESPHTTVYLLAISIFAYLSPFARYWQWNCIWPWPRPVERTEVKYKYDNENTVNTRLYIPSSNLINFNSKELNSIHPVVLALYLSIGYCTVKCFFVVLDSADAGSVQIHVTYRMLCHMCQGFAMWCRACYGSD